MSTDKSHRLTDELLESMREEVDIFLLPMKKNLTSIEYETKVIEVVRKFAERLISGGLGQIPKDRNAKKF